MNDSGKEGWELVTVVAVTDYHPLDLIEVDVDPEKANEVVQLEDRALENVSECRAEPPGATKPRTVNCAAAGSVNQPSKVERRD